MQELICEGDRVVGATYQHDGGTHTVRAKYVVDAGGRASKTAKLFGVRKPNDKLRMVAVFHHLKGVEEANNPGVEGDIQVGAHNDGWLWAIPIWPDTISVGAVMPQSVIRDGDPATLLAEHEQRVDRISQRIKGGTQVGDVHIESDYCYYSDTVAGEGWIMAGDAGCFFDPIFSGGVHLAVSTGFGAAQTVDQILKTPERADQLTKRYQDFYKTGYDTNGRIVYGYYEFHHNLQVMVQTIGLGGLEVPENHHVVAEAIAGDFWAVGNRFLSLMRKESRWNTFDEPFEFIEGNDLLAA